MPLAQPTVVGSDPTTAPQDADDWAMSAAGSIFSNFNFNLARCVWAGREAVRDAAATVLEKGHDPERPELQKRQWLSTPSLQSDREGGSGGGRSGASTFAFMLEPLSVCLQNLQLQ